METKGKVSSQGSKSRMTPAALMRLAGLAAMIAGLCFIIIGLFHQENVPASVATATWVNVHYAAVAMGFFGLFGMMGLYARQVEKAGWLGLTGFVMFSVWLAIVMCVSFVEAIILPQLAAALPAYAESFMGMFAGVPGAIDLGLLPAIWSISGPLFIVGPLLFGIATFRAGVLPRGAAGLMALGSVLIPAGAFLPPQLESLVMVPAGLAMTWLGYALLAERRAKTSGTVHSQISVAPEPGNAA